MMPSLSSSTPADNVSCWNSSSRYTRFSWSPRYSQRCGGMTNWTRRPIGHNFLLYRRRKIFQRRGASVLDVFGAFSAYAPQDNASDDCSDTATKFVVDGFVQFHQKLRDSTYLLYRQRVWRHLEAMPITATSVASGELFQLETINFFRALLWAHGHIIPASRKEFLYYKSGFDIKSRNISYAGLGKSRTRDLRFPQPIEDGNSSRQSVIAESLKTWFVRHKEYKCTANITPSIFFFELG